jgi:hypothetical protein
LSLRVKKAYSEESVYRSIMVPYLCTKGTNRDPKGTNRDPTRQTASKGELNQALRTSRTKCRWKPSSCDIPLQQWITLLALGCVVK